MLQIEYIYVFYGLNVLKRLNNEVRVESGTLLRGHPDKRSTPQKRPLVNVNSNMKELISTPDERSTFLVKKAWPYKKGFSVSAYLVCYILKQNRKCKSRIF